MIMFDIETLSIKSDAVVLSAAAIRFSLDDTQKVRGGSLNDLYREYCRSACFVKFNVSEQFKMKRGTDESTMEWWTKQNQLVREKSFTPSKIDVGTVAGIKTLLEYSMQGDPEPTMWQRGGLDQVVFEDLSRQFQQPILPFWKWMDVRTMINLSKETATRGYCDIPGFDRQFVVKHDPVHDCAYDIMMMLWGK